MEIIYSSQPIPEKGGRKAINPAFFTLPEDGVTTVYLNGDYPYIEAAYEELGIRVLPLSEMPLSKPAKSGEPSKKGA